MMPSNPGRARSSQRIRRRRNTLIVGALLGLLSLIAVQARDSLWDSGLLRTLLSFLEIAPAEPVPIWTLARRDHKVTARARGVLAGLYSVPVRAPRLRSGALRIAWLVPEGSVVARGEPLVRFDETEARLSLEQGQNQLKAQHHLVQGSTVRQEGEVRRLQMEQEAADLEQAFAQSQVRKDETIFSQWEIRESLMDADLAESRLDFLANQEGLQKELGASQLREQNVDRNNARAQVELAREVLSSLSIEAAAPGVVVYRKISFTPPEVGSTVWPGQTIMEISSAERFRAIVSIPEIDITQIQIGSRAEIELDAFPGQMLKGQIESLSRVARQLQKADPRKYFECSVLIDLAEVPRMALKPGMDLEASILVGQFPESLALPKSAVFRKDGRTFVFVADGGSDFREQDIRVVASDHGFHVVEGLEEGTAVCLRHPDLREEMLLPDFSTPAGATRDSEFVVVE